MKEDKFIRENIETWKFLESTVAKLKSKGFKKFGKDELNNFMYSYNLVCGHLSYSRTYFGNTKTTDYLNRLVASAHSYIYATRTSNAKKMLKFFFMDFPLLIKQNIGYLIASTSLFLGAVLLSFIFTAVSPDNASAFMPQELIDGINNFSDTGRKWDSAIQSSSIMTNNIQVGFLAFALGVTLGVGTCYIMILNGFILGGAAALALNKGISVQFWALILPHGVFELFAIFVCGASGLLIGKSIVNPGKFSRKDSMVRYGKTAIYLICCTIPIFTIAGIIEGFFTPSGVSHAGKLMFSLFTLLLLVFYMVFPVLIKRKKQVIK
jgi:uncharacterized membrane protein SpoIIM required for sporulation